MLLRREIGGRVSDTVSGLSLRSVSGHRAGLLVFAVLVLLVSVVFLALPWPVEVKSLAALHGLCAQRPSHSFWFGESRLPFDARMTGIYGAFLATTGYLAGTGRWRRAGLPSWPVLSLLAGGVPALGIDGFNALFHDLGLQVLYEPRNWLRFVTGSWTGVLLGVVVWMAANAVVWRPGPLTSRAVLEGPRDLMRLVWLVGVLGVLVMSGWRLLYWPLAHGLVVAAATLLTLLALPVIQLLRRREQQVERLAELGWPASGALVVACAFMVTTSALRFLLERIAGLPALP
jgi:uncharacterized membrane protein